MPSLYTTVLVTATSIEDVAVVSTDFAESYTTIPTIVIQDGADHNHHDPGCRRCPDRIPRSHHHQCYQRHINSGCRRYKTTLDVITAIITKNTVTIFTTQQTPTTATNTVKETATFASKPVVNPSFDTSSLFPWAALSSSTGAGQTGGSTLDNPKSSRSFQCASFNKNGNCGVKQTLTTCAGVTYSCQCDWYFSTADSSKGMFPTMVI